MRAFERFYSTVIVLLVLLLAITPAVAQTAGDYVEEAKQEFAKQDFDGAIISCTRSILLNPNLAEPYALRGLAEGMLNEPYAALGDFTRAIGLDPSTAAYYRFRANLLEGLDELPAAFLDLDAAIRLEPNNADGYNLRGFIYFKMDDSLAAQGDFSKAITLQPKFADAYLNRGMLYEWREKYDSARLDYSRAISLAPLNARGWAGRGHAKLMLGDTVSARVDVQRAIDLDSATFYYRLRAYLASSLTEAIRTLDTALMRRPSDPQAYYERGGYKRDAGDTTGALADLAMAIRIAPGYLNALLTAADLKADLGEYHAAIEDETQAIMIDSTDPARFDYRASYYLEARDTDRAMADYRQALVLDERDSDALASIAWILNDRGSNSDRLEAINNFLRYFPREGSAHSFRAACLYQTDPKGAEVEYDSAIAFDGTDADDYYWRGMLRQQAGRMEAAISDYRAAIQIDSARPIAWQALAEALCQKQECELALSALSGAIQLRPDTSALWVARAKVREAMKDLSGAMEDFKSALRHGTDAEIYIERAHFMLRHGDTVSALRDFESAIERNAGVETRMERGKIEIEQRVLDNAVRDFDFVIKQEPENADAWFWRGYAFFRLNELRKAFDDFTISIRVEPTAWAYTDRAESARLLTEDSLALQDVVHAIDLDSTIANPYWIRGRIELRRGLWRDAVSDFTTCIQLSPESLDALLYRAIALEYLNDHVRALRDVRAGHGAINQLDEADLTRIRAIEARN